MNRDKYITIAELKEYLKIGTNTAYALIHIQGFPCIKIGKRYIIDTDELDTYLKRNPDVLQG
jgi:excisionase family DNA binding protein